MWNDFGNPAPIIDRSYGDPGLSAKKRNSDHAGTMGHCKHCGRPTYRTVGSSYVCSYCTSKEADKWPSANRDQ